MSGIEEKLKAEREAADPHIRQARALEQIADMLGHIRGDTMQSHLQLQRIAKALETGTGKPF